MISRRAAMSGRKAIELTRPDIPEILCSTDGRFKDGHFIDRRLIDGGFISGSFINGRFINGYLASMGVF
jgi:hypothetical protein